MLTNNNPFNIVVCLLLVMCVVLCIVSIIHARSLYANWFTNWYIQENGLITESFENNKTSSKVSSDKQISADDCAVFLINMKKNRDRFERFDQSYKNTDLSEVPFIRIEGVNGRKLNLEKYVAPRALHDLLENEKNGHRQYHYQLTRGAVGCYLSHLNVYKEFLKTNREYAFVFEDDVRFNESQVLGELNKVIDTVPRNWDIILLGCVCFVCGKFECYYDVNRYFLMHGYLIRRSSAQKILDHMDGKLIEQQIDARLSDLTENKEMRIYCLRKKLASQWNMGTAIQIPVKNTKGVNPFETYHESSKDNDESNNSKNPYSDSDDE